MVDVYTATFLALLAAYMAVSVWLRVDGRFPVAGALVLLVAAAVLDATGATTSANTLAEFVFFLLGAGVLLLLVEHVRERRAATASDRPVPGQPAAEGRQLADERQRTAENPFDRLEQKPVAGVERARDDDGAQEDEAEKHREDR